MTKHPLIRTIYLYLFTLVGLALLTIGVARLVTLGLKTYIFTQADVYYVYPQSRPVKPAVEGQEAAKEVTEPTQKEIADYEKKQRTSNRQREAAESLGFIIVGLPLYLYHWSVIQRDKKRE